MNNTRWRPMATYVLIGINVLVFLLETIMGGSENLETALAFGALYTPLVMNGEIFRMVTAMFLHFGIQHLSSNMLSLFALGQYAEAYFGHVRFVLLYLLSGLGGNLTVLAVDRLTGRMPLSAGASGAVCGVLGVFLLFSLKPQMRRMFPMRRILVAIFLTFYASAADRSISLAAHLGGFVTGFCLAVVFDLLERFRKGKAENGSGRGSFEV